jgi:rSAM/selenodomain-associated transferase 2
VVSQLSIVIPTLNAEAALRRSLPSLATLGALSLIREVIFADGCSTDRTTEIALKSGAEVVSSAKGRGTQLTAGAEAAKGNWLLFLHADTVLNPGWEIAAAEFISEPENAEKVGYFRFRLDDASSGARWLEKMVAARCRVLQLPYGDQGLLVSRALYHRLGGFKAIPLMEDVEFVRRAGRRRMTVLDQEATTSASRYREDGYVLRPFRNLFCLTLYFVGVPPRTIAKLYG